VKHRSGIARIPESSITSHRCPSIFIFNFVFDEVLLALFFDVIASLLHYFTYTMEPDLGGMIWLI
jgi:hypothetical protein